MPPLRFPPAPLLGARELQDLDLATSRETSLDPRILMELAGAGAAAAAIQEELVRPGIDEVIVLAGPGNNGGDGFVMARHLRLAGVRVRVAVLAGLGPSRTPESRINAALLRDFEIPCDPVPVARLGALLAPPAVLVDALLGIGLRGAPRPPLSEAIEVMNASRCRVLSLDVPSGLPTDEASGADFIVRADVTITFGARKIEMSTPASRAFVGRVILVPLPYPPRLWPTSGAASGS